jgi:hypothetical protein
MTPVPPASGLKSSCRVKSMFIDDPRWTRGVD